MTLNEIFDLFNYPEIKMKYTTFSSVCDGLAKQDFSDIIDDIHDYYIDAYDNEYLRFNYETDSSISTVKIENNGNFNDGNNDVTVNITSNNNMNNNKYVIHVSKTKSVFKSEEDSVKELSYNSKKIVIISVITICSFLVVLCFYLLFVKKIF